VTIYSDISGIKEREQRLHEQQSILQSVLDHIPVAVTMTDLDSRLVLINREAEKRYQVTAEAAIGMPAAEVVPAQLRPPTSEEDQEEVLVTGKPIIDREYTMRSDGNEERWLITRVPIFDDAGRTKFVLRAASVVPQLTQAYKELATSRALLLDAQRRAKLAYWSWEAGMGWDTLWSEEAAAVFGMAPGAVPIEGEAFHRLVHPDDLPMATLAYQALFKEGRPFQIEYRVPQHDGSVKWIRETGDVELDSDRQPARMIGTVQDITGQKQIEEKLKESQVRLRAFMDHAPMIMYLKDLEGRYQLVNKEFEQVEGVTEDQVRGRTLQELKPRASRPALAEQDREVLELGRVSIREIEDHWEPARRHLLVVKFPVRSSNGEVSGIGCYAQDFTEQKRVEEDLRQKEAHLRNAQRLARIGIWQWLPETDELHWSKEALQIFGYSEEETLQSPSAWLDRIHPDDRTAVIAKFNAHDDGRERFDLTYRIVLPDGSIRAIREEIERSFDDSGECIGETGTVQDITEWESTQRALRESQEQLLDAQRRAKLAYWVWDIATDRLSWSKGAPELLGIADEHLPASDSDSLRFIHPDDRDRVAETYARAARDLAPYVIEYRAVRPDGQFGWFRELAETVYDESNMPLRMHGTMQDVSDQKRVEEELRQSQTDLLASQRRAQIATWQWNIGDGDFYTWSSEATQVLGLPADRLPQSDAEYVKLVVAADKRKVELAMTRAMNEHTPIDVEYRITKANGTVAWMRELSETQLDGAGKPVRMIGTVQDVTGQKRIEEALRESEAMLREAQRRAKIAAWHWDIAGGDVYTWSGEAAMVLGCQEDQLPKSAAEYLKIVHPADQEKVAEAIERTFKLQEPFEVEYRIVRSDKSIAWMRELSSIQTDDAGNPVRIIGTVQDFSEQKQLQEQLLQAQKMEAVGQLTGGIAHDFNNLLAIILGNLEIIQARSDLNPAVGKRINTAISTTLRGAELTHRLLAFGRRQPLAPKATNVNELIRGLQELIRRPLGPHIDISVVEAEGLWLTEVDSAQLENALLNLALNARDAMPRGGKLTIESWNVAIGASDLSGGEELDPGDYVAIAVSDSGDGMPPEVVARAFEPFFTTKGVGKGTGLGLSMVYGFVKQSGGHVKLYSELGHGTTVKILLPRLNNEQAPTAADASEERSGRGEQILVIDDEADLRELACSYLESLGYHVVSAADGLEGLATLDRMKRIDLLLTDVILPGNLDGRAIAREARKRYPDLKVLYMSGYAPQASTRSGRIDDAGLMISKPFRKSELSRKLREILDGKLQTESAKR
jgi:PAS domain S-box-containing protein